MRPTSAEGEQGQRPGFGPAQFESRTNRRALLEAALLELGPDWIILADVRIDIPPGSFATDYLLIHPDRGIAVLDRAARRPAASRSVASFRSFLRERGFDAFHPGYLPIVQLDAGVPDSLALGHRIAAVFAAAPPLTINDRDWGEAVGTVLTEPHRDRAPSAPDNREDPIVTKTAAHGIPTDDSIEAKSPAKSPDLAKSPELAKSRDNDRGPALHIDKRLLARAPVVPRTDRSALRADRVNRIDDGYAFRVDGARFGSVLGSLFVLGALAVWLVPSGTAIDPVEFPVPISAARPTADMVQRDASSPAPSGTATASRAPDAKIALGEGPAGPMPPLAEATPASASVRREDRREEPLDSPRIISPAFNQVAPPPLAHAEMTASRRLHQVGTNSPHTTVAPVAVPRYVRELRLAAARSSRAVPSPRSVRGDLAPPIDAADLPPLDRTPSLVPRP
jgi:hypothetical protein